MKNLFKIPARNQHIICLWPVLSTYTAKWASQKRRDIPKRMMEHKGIKYKLLVVGQLNTLYSVIVILRTWKVVGSVIFGRRS